MTRRTTGVLALIMGLCLGSACGDDDDGPIAPDNPGRRDAGNDDEPDANGPLPRRDSGAPDVEPGDPEPGLIGTCAIDSNKIYTVAERDEPFLTTPLAVDPNRSSFALPVVDDGSCLDAVNLASMAGAASSGGPQMSVAIDACALVREAVAAASGERWLLATVDNREAPYDVWLQPYAAGKKELGKAQRLSSTSTVEGELALATLRDGENAMLAWSDEGAGQAVHVRPIDKDGAPRGAAVEIERSDTLFYHGLAIDALGADGAALVYWRYSDDFSTSELVFVALDSAGKPLRDAWLLAANAGPSASINLAIDEDGGGIVYARAEAGSGRQVWFQQIDDTGQAAMARTGTARASPVRIVNAPFLGIDVSLAKLRSSYVLAYRALPALMQTRAQIRLYFLDRFGAIIGGSDVSFTSSSSGRTAVRSAYDGRVVIGWTQVNEEDAKSVTKVVRLPCVGG
jgi:hypothetical protein